MTSAENGSGARRPVDVAPAPETASPGGPDLGTPATRDESRRGPAQPYSSARASALRWLPWLALALAALAGAVVDGGGALAGVSAGVLAVASTLLGWFFGEKRRITLVEEVEGSSNELRRALTELQIAQEETVRRLSMAVEFRDEDTGAHIERIGRFSSLLAEQIGMDGEFCDRIGHAAPLHDVGKVAIPDAILLKPGPLTAEERAIVETHAEEGYRLVGGSSSVILDMAAAIALSHQEKWDGSGYPRGLAGEAIPIEGRIVSIADVFDALTSDRVYRKAFSVEEALQILREQRGRHFDPVLLDAFLEVLERSGPDARAHENADPAALAESTLQTYAGALERGDAETAEGAVAEAIEQGVPPTMLHGEVIAPALRRLDELHAAGEIDDERRALTQGITRRVLATLYRYMLGGAEATRERVLVAGVDGDDHPLELQMMHDQLAAAGYRTILDQKLAAKDLGKAVDTYSPDVVLLGAAVPASAQELEFAVSKLRERHAEIPIVLGGVAAGGKVPAEHQGMRVLERIDESVEAVGELLAARAPAASR